MDRSSRGLFQIHFPGGQGQYDGFEHCAAITEACRRAGVLCNSSKIEFETSLGRNYYPGPTYLQVLPLRIR